MGREARVVRATPRMQKKIRRPVTIWSAADLHDKVVPKKKDK